MAEHSRQRLNLTGQRFGKLTVLAPAENIGSRTAWHCRCDCGQEITTTTLDLRRGHRTSCGCDRPVVDSLPGGYGRASLTYVDGTCVELIRANTRRCNNTGGVTGVEWMPDLNKWKAVIHFKGKRHYLGLYGRVEDAVKARQRGEGEYFKTFLAAYSQPSGSQKELGDDNE